MPCLVDQSSPESGDLSAFFVLIAARPESEILMSVANRATQKKRQRELAQRERQMSKGDRVAERDARKKERELALLENPGQDPDLIGIYPGPQKIDELDE